ncbi:hypothetical protein SUGI_0717320 [Cryptomeria japonica]|nr:hypothetical protein SUGI_0717320 [Cryptomeria japonica]
MVWRYRVPYRLFRESSVLTSANATGGITWINNYRSLDFLPPSVYADALVRPILVSPAILYNEMNLQFRCGFFCYGNPCDTGYLIATFFVIKNKDGVLYDMQMKLKVGQKLIANISPTNTSPGILYRSLSVDSFLLSTATTSPQIYYRFPDSPSLVKLSYVQFDNESIYMFPMAFVEMGSAAVQTKAIILFRLTPHSPIQSAFLTDLLYGVNFSSGYCYLESNVYSLTMSNQSDLFYNSTAYIKVQSRPKQIKLLVIVIICTAIGGVFVLFLLLCTWISKYMKGRHEKDEDEDDHVDWPPGLRLRYTFQELKNATNVFTMKLGRGGFSSVYEGVLAEGSKIAVKRLDGAAQGKRAFRA